jgi:hypothetical protein
MSNDYPYQNYIKPPEDIGMSSKGDLKTLGKNITGLIAYTDLLVSGGGKASSTGGYLGNKYFLNTMSKCKDDKSGTEQDKYAYINNVSESGLIGGLIGSMTKINPGSIISAAFQSETPDCREITLETIDSNNNSKYETHYVAVSDIDRDGLKDLPNKKNKQGFQSMTESMNGQSMTENMTGPKMPKDTVTQIYFASLAALSVLLFYKMVVNRSH